MKKSIPTLLATFVLVLSATLLSFIMIRLADFVSEDIYAESESEYAVGFYSD